MNLSRIKFFIKMQSWTETIKYNIKSIDRLQQIFDIIAKDGFADEVLQEINKYIKDIQNGTEDFSRFNLSEHAGLSKGGSPLIGASIIACYATASIAASCNAEGREGSPANWEIDRSVFARLVMGRV